MQIIKNIATPKTNQPLKSERVIHPIWIASFVITLGIAFLFGTSGFQTYWGKERRLIAAAGEIVTALKTYRDASPGTAKEFPLELADLMRDPRMLADKGYLTALPVDPIAQKQEWGVVRNKNNQVIGVHSLSKEAPTFLAKLLSIRGGEKYSDWKFLAE
jgi:hypothetical protein